MTIVINLDETERPGEVRIRGLGDCVVTVPGLHHDSALRSYYTHPSRTSAAAFVNDLLALSVSPRRSASEFAALPERDGPGCGARLRWLPGTRSSGGVCTART